MPEMEPCPPGTCSQCEEDGLYEDTEPDYVWKPPVRKWYHYHSLNKGRFHASFAPSDFQLGVGFQSWSGKMPYYLYVAFGPFSFGVEA